MKKCHAKPLLFLIILLLGACMPYSRYVHESARLTELPTRPHQRKVEVFFNNEIPTNRPYAKMEILETIVSSTKSDANTAIFQLQSQAQQRGYDALIMLNTIGYAATQGYDPVTTSVLSDKYQALGIIFLDQIDYLDQCVKEQNVYAYNTATLNFEPAGKLLVPLAGGSVEKEGNSPLLSQARLFSLNYLLDERTSNWIYSDWTDPSFRLNIKRKYQKAGQTLATVHIRYQPNRPDRLLDIRLRQLNKPLMTFTFTYDKQGRVTEKNISSTEFGLIKEILKYNEKGVHAESHFFIIKDGSQLPLMQIINEFYKKEDLNKFLEQG